MFVRIFNLFALISSVITQNAEGDIMPRPTMVGGQLDENNCLTGAGYSWCESSQLCIRRWVTPCADNYDNCDDCLKRQRKGENIACPVNCVHDRDITDCSHLPGRRT